MFLQNIKRTVVSLLCICSFVSCAQEEMQNGDSVFFDTQNFMSQQINVLEQLNPSVQRINKLNGEQEEMLLTDIDWETELALFVDADINKSSYLPSYTVAKPTNLITTYTLKQGENLPVKYMEIAIDSTSQQPRSIVVTLYRNNKLFDTEKNLRLDLMDYNGKTIINKYQVEGYQNVMLLGKTTFSLQGIVNLK
jgi:hypothetical protein